MLACSEARIVGTALHRAPSESDGARGPAGPVHGGGGRGPGADDRLAEGRADVADQRRRPLPHRDGRRPVVATHRRRQTQRQRLVSVHCRQCRWNGHQPSPPRRTGYYEFVLIIIASASARRISTNAASAVKGPFIATQLNSTV